MHPGLSLDNISDRETIVPFYSKDVAVDLRRRRVGVTNLTHGEDNPGHDQTQAQVLYPKMKVTKFIINCSFAWSTWMRSSGELAEDLRKGHQTADLACRGLAGNVNSPSPAFATRAYTRL
jgi:hypothetical protein